MSSSQVRERIAALRVEAQAVGELLVQQASSMGADELFEVAGELQGVLNAGEGAQLVAAAHAASHETRLTGRGPVEVHHEVGFIDAMAPSEVSLATGVGQWAAGRRVALGAALTERFPLLLAKVLAGEVCTGTVQRVVTVCEGLDKAACAKVDAIMAGKLADLDPGRVAAFTRRVATRVAGEQLRAAQRRNRRDRFVETRPGPDGATWWSALLPAATSAVAWSAITTLGAEYAAKDESLTADQARADAFTDLLLRNVTVTAKVTLGIPVITDTAREDTAPGAPGHRSGCRHRHRSGCRHRPQRRATSTRPGSVGRAWGRRSGSPRCSAGARSPASGSSTPTPSRRCCRPCRLQVGRALLDARTGTVLETTTTAYRPTKGITDFVGTRDGTCRMWGCDRPARACDLDHVKPWPAGATSPANLGGLCRRHHRLKQRGRWTYVLHPDGTRGLDRAIGQATHHPRRPHHLATPEGTPSPERCEYRSRHGRRPVDSRHHLGRAALLTGHPSGCGTGQGFLRDRLVRFPTPSPGCRLPSSGAAADVDESEDPPVASTNDLKNGLVLNLEGQLWTVVEFQHVKPGKGPAFVRTKLKNVLSGKVVDKTFNAGVKVETANVDKRNMQYLYNDGTDFIFMDGDTYDQISVTPEVVGDAAKYMLENQEAIVARHDGAVLFIELPASVVLEISYTEPGLQGDRSTGGTKPATLETGAEIAVPLFLETGTKVKVDTRDGSYLGRVS